MDPLPETAAAMQLLTPDDTHLAESLCQAASDLAVAAPTAMGFSLGVVKDGITLTYLSSDAALRLLDSVQYLSGGPCEDAVSAAEPLEFGTDDPLDEQSWDLFARASAARGVHSTLSLPILRAGAVIAGVNIYGHRKDTFHGRHDAVAKVFGAWAAGAVSNADLSFSTRVEAVKAPVLIGDMTLLETAVGVFVARYAISPAAARSKLFESAARAGIPVGTLARLIIDELEKGTS